MDPNDPGTEAEALNDMLENGDEDSDNFLPVRETIRFFIRDRDVKAEAVKLYETNKGHKVGTTCVCPSCKKEFNKASYQQSFCSNKGQGNCKDIFWNRVRPERAQRAQKFSRYR